MQFASITKLARPFVLHEHIISCIDIRVPK